jgi:hypothetical protein
MPREKTLKPIKLAALVAAASMLAPVAALAQGAPASWATKEGRWNNWKAGSFATSMAQYNALKAAAKGGTKHTKASVPDWSGIWTNTNFLPGAPKDWAQPRYRPVPGQGVTVVSPPPPAGPERHVLTPEAAKKFEETLTQVSKGIEWDYLSYCLPAGFPRWYTEPFLREFITTPKETWMINEQQSEVRRIYTDGRGHVPDDESYALWEGDSIGFWDGDTLVVHTVSTKPGSWNRSEPEYSDKAETVELVKKNKDGRIETRMTVYDPETLQKPWHVIFGSSLVDLKPTPNLRINMWSCNENNNVVKTGAGASDFVLPGEAGYKDPDKLQTAPK